MSRDVALTRRAVIVTGANQELARAIARRSGDTGVSMVPAARGARLLDRVFGRDGKRQEDDLGDGLDRPGCCDGRPETGSVPSTSREYPGDDRSWRDESWHLVDGIRAGGPPLESLAAAVVARDVGDQAYARRGTGR